MIHEYYSFLSKPYQFVSAYMWIRDAYNICVEICMMMDGIERDGAA